LHCIDCQGLFCETDKYSRVAFPELKSNRKRIKTTFQQNVQKIEYFYPSKWKINEKVFAMLEQYKVGKAHASPLHQQLLFGLSGV